MRLLRFAETHPIIQHVFRSAEIARGRPHFAYRPGKGTYYKLFRIPDIDYTVADIELERYAFAENCRQIDLTDMEDFYGSQFDYIFNIHVIEHIPCTLAYPRFHLHRMLKTDGLHLCVILFLSDHFDESLVDIGDDERVRPFGQDGPVRRLGAVDAGSHLGNIVNIPEMFDATKDSMPEQLQDANFLNPHQYGFHPQIVLSLTK